MSLIVREYRCPAGHQFDEIVDRADDPAEHACACGETAARIISAPRLKFPLVSVTTTGRSVSERPPNVPDTSLLADGMDIGEWKQRHEPPRQKDDDFERAVRRVRNMPESREHEI